MKACISAVVFDMDGVIFDTERIVLEAWEILGRRHNFERVDEVLKECLGLNAQAVEGTFKKAYGKNFPYKKYMKENLELYFGPLYGKHFPIKKGAVEFLNVLKENNVPIALASSTQYSFVKKELSDANLIQFFDKLICGDMVKRSKPEPDIFLTACDELNVLPSECYVIEDSFNGIRAAYKAGLRPIMVPDLAEPTREMYELSECVCDSLFDVMEYMGFCI